MEQTNGTETEQLYNDMTGKADEEQPEEVEEVDEQAEQEQEQEQDEIVDDEQLEIEREIAEYATKIEQLDAKLAAYEAQHIDALKRAEMRNMQYSEEQIERYLSHIEGETADKIKESIFKLTLEIPPRDIYGDPSPMNGRANRPKPVDHESVGREIGKKAFERVKNKIHGLRWW